MRVVAGLGNPGTKYELTRHNVGFQILDRFAEKHRLRFKSSKKNYNYSEGVINTSSKETSQSRHCLPDRQAADRLAEQIEDSHDFFLVKPATFMNMSGEAILDFVRDHPVDLENLIVVFDDVNLPLGEVRLRKSGGDGGHNGIKSIIYHLQSNSFPRLRFGIGNEFEKGEMAQFVLDKFSKDEFKIIDESIKFAVGLIEEFIYGGYKTMLDYFSKNVTPQ